MATEDDWAAYRTAIVDLEPPGRAPFRIVPVERGSVGRWPDSLASPVAVVTAWNPDGIRLPDGRNATRHRALVQELASRVPAWWPATGRDVPGAHHEEGVALPGLAEAEALDLGRRHGQAAIYVWTPAAWEIVSCTGVRRETLGWRVTGVPKRPD